MEKLVEDVIVEHPLARRFERPAHEIDTAFPRATTPGARLLLQQFARDRPYKFFSRDAFSGANDVLRQLTPEHVASLPQSTFGEVAEALRILRQVNSTAEDAGRTFDSHEQLRAHRLHTEAFATYSRLAEHVFGPLLALLVKANAVSTGKDCTVPHQLKSRWEMAKAKRSPLHPGLTRSYNPTIRNAIVHGGVTLGEHAVTFRDDNGAVEQLSYSDAEQLGERLLDTCNGVYAALSYALALAAALTNRLEAWKATEQAIAWSRAPFLRPDASYVSDYGAGVQAELHGRHSHWRWDQLLFDIARAFIAMRMAFPKADRHFLSFRSPEGASSFFSSPAKDIPDGNASLERFGQFVNELASGGQGVLWVEHHRVLPQLLAKTALGPWLNWVDVLDRGLGNVDYELRELRNLSNGWRSRFEAYLVSTPRPEDLDDDAKPTRQYLQAIFDETFQRWLVRAPQRRPVGANRFRFFDLGILNVYRADRRKRDLRGSGLPANFIFRFQFLQRLGPPLSGSRWERIGPFYVCINPAGAPELGRIKGLSAANDPKAEASE